MRNGIILAGIAFAIVLAVIVGNRLSNEAMAVVVGAICGISASIPVSIGLVIAANHNWGRTDIPREIGYDYGSHHFTPQTPMIIVSPPQTQMSYGFQQGQYVAPSNAPMLGAPREFKIIGDE